MKEKAIKELAMKREKEIAVFENRYFEEYYEVEIAKEKLNTSGLTGRKAGGSGLTGPLGNVLRNA